MAQPECSQRRSQDQTRASEKAIQLFCEASMLDTQAANAIGEGYVMLNDRDGR